MNNRMKIKGDRTKGNTILVMQGKNYEQENKYKRNKEERKQERK